LQVASKQAGCRIAGKQAGRQAGRAGKVVLSKLLSDHLSFSLHIWPTSCSTKGISIQQPKSNNNRLFWLKTYDHTNKSLLVLLLLITGGGCMLTTYIILTAHSYKQSNCNFGIFANKQKKKKKTKKVDILLTTLTNIIHSSYS